jgi:Flp pilus assembly protein TadB
MALAGAVLILVTTVWFDNTVMRGAAQSAQATFGQSGLGVMIAAWSMMIAGSVLLVGLLAWRAPSVVVGIAYAVVGGFLVALPWIVSTFATQVNDVPPVLPEPLLSVVSEISFLTRGSSMNAVGTIGAAMLIAGVVALVRWQRDRVGASGSIEAVSPAAGPTLP